jgi:hypothetical protein
MRALPTFVLLAGLLGAGAAQAQADSFTFTFSDAGTAVATGSFSFAPGTTGIVSGYSSLTSFNLDVAGVDYTLADVLPLTDYVNFQFNTSTDTFVDDTNSCGFDGCGFDNLLGAINSDGTYGFFFTPVPGEYQEYSTGAGGSIDTLLISAVPEPASLAALIVGLGMVGYVRRRRAI